MKNAFKLFLLAAIVLSGCSSSNSDKAPVVVKTEDEKMTEALVGEFYVDNRTEEDGTNVTNITNHYYKDGKFDGKATFEGYEPEFGDLISVTIQISGTWKVKDKFIYYTYDKVTSDNPNLDAEVMLESVRKKISPDKIVEYDAAKVIYEDADGKRTTMKKSY